MSVMHSRGVLIIFIEKYNRDVIVCVIRPKAEKEEGQKSAGLNCLANIVEETFFLVMLLNHREVDKTFCCPGGKQRKSMGQRKQRGEQAHNNKLISEVIWRDFIFFVPELVPS